MFESPRQHFSVGRIDSPMNDHVLIALVPKTNICGPKMVSKALTYCFLDTLDGGGCLAFLSNSHCHDDNAEP